MSDENENINVQEDDTPATNPIFKYQVLFHNGDESEAVLQVQRGYFDNDRTINPIHTYYYDYNSRQLIDNGYYTAKDYDMIWENENDSRWPWSTIRQYVYYQGRWYINYRPSSEKHYIVDEVSNNDIVDEGLSMFQIYYYNENWQESYDYQLIYCSSANEITVNGQKVTAQYEDWVYTRQCSDMVFLPPGIWYDDNNSGYGYICTAVPNEIKYRYLGQTGTNVQDHDTDPDVIINERTVTAQDYDMVYNYNNYTSLMYYEGEWCNVNARLNKIGQLWQNPPDDIPEITNVALVNDPDEPDFKDYNRVCGLNIDIVTINGVATQVQLFDYIEIGNPYGASSHYRLIYGPGNIWIMDSDILWINSNSIENDYRDVPIKNGFSIVEKHVELKWQDPSDITDYKPHPAEWKGTIVIRKENSPPLNRWDGIEIVKTTTSNKNAYKDTPYKDEDIQLGRTYYYGFFPYYKAREEDGHNINFFRYTKVIRVDTGVVANGPIINSVTADDTAVTISYKIPADAKGYSSVILYGKKNKNPSCTVDDDIVQDIDPEEETITLTGLSYDTTYYFCIQSTNNDDLILSSNVEIAKISVGPYLLNTYNFDEIGLKNLVQISDLTIIPQSVIEASSPIKVSDFASISYITDQADELGKYGSGGETSREVIIIDNEYMKLSYGVVPTNPSGARYGLGVYDKITDNAIAVSGWSGLWGTGGNFHLGVLVDPINHRAYLLFYDYSSYSGWHFDVVGGKSNGTDIFWETFKNV